MKVAVVILAVFVLYVGIDTIVGLKSELFASEAYVEQDYMAMQATAYCIDGTTATGTHTRKGICAGKREWFGKTAVVYADNNGEIGDLIGVYLVEDTGGKDIRSGRVIDIWLPTESECKQFGRQNVHVYILD